MADKIRGITIELGGDASGLSKALKGVNSEIKDTQKQLKDVERLLKLDPSNTELLRQKHELLAKSVSGTKEKLEQLHKAEKQLRDSGVDENSAQFMALKREIISTEDELEGLTKAANESNVALSKIGAVADKVSSGASKIASATIGLSASAAAGLTGIAGLAVKAVTAADDLNTLSKQTGLSTETLQQAQYAADLIDVSYDTFTGSVQKMTGKLRTNEKAFSDLGIATRDLDGNLLGTEEIFWRSVDALKNIENETERDIVAQELFGKSAAELSGIIDDGGEAFKALGKEAKDAGLIMSQETLDGLNDVNDQLDTLKAKAKGTAAVSGAKALEAMMPIIDKVIDGVGRLFEWIGRLDESQIRLIMIILSVVAAISPVAGIVSNISGAISNLMPLISKVQAFIVANPIVLLIAAIVALVALIATKGDEIQALLQRLDDWLQGVFAKDWTEIFGPILGEGLNAFFANVKNIWDGIKQIFDGIIDFIRGVFTGDWQRAWEGVKGIFSGIVNTLAGIFKVPINAIIGLINGAINGINRMIDGLNNLRFNIPDWVPGLGGKSFGLNLSHIGNIPYLAKGGILSKGSAIVGEAGPELLTMSGGRAVVQPLTNNTTNHNLGGVNITVYGAPGQDVRDLAEIIMDEIQAATDRKGAALA